MSDSDSVKCVLQTKRKIGCMRDLRNSDDNFFCRNAVNVSCCDVKYYRFQSQLEPPLLCHHVCSHGDRSILLSWGAIHAKINKEMKYTALRCHLVLQQESSFKHSNFSMLPILTMIFIHVIITMVQNQYLLSPNLV